MSTQPPVDRPSVLPRFAGFPPGDMLGARLPETFVRELLPLIDDLDELKVTLYCIWAIQQAAAPRHNDFRYLRERDVIDGVEQAGLVADGTALRAALRRVVLRGTLIGIEIESHSGAEVIYFMNTEHGRVAADALEAGEWHPAEASEVDHLNIYQLYERHFTMLTPAMSDVLRDVEATYPAEWIQAAIAQAAAKNVHYWKYVENVLKRWAAEADSHE